MKKNRAFGITIVGSDKSLWNGDFEGNPNKCLNEYVASPFCLKYAYRQYFKQIGLPVLFYKTFYEKLDKDVLKIYPKSLDRTLNDMIELAFGEGSTSEVEDTSKKGKGKGKTKKKANISQKEIQDMVFKCIDVSCFGGAFATTMFTKSYVGAIQFGYAINKYDPAETIKNTTLTQFQNKENSEQTTLGEITYLSEGHFVYDFVVNPFVNSSYRELFPDFKGLSDEDYEEFKKASLTCVNSQQSLAKKGCYNEFAMFVELKEGSTKYLGNLNKKVLYSKSEDGKGIIDLSLVEKDLEAIMDDIERIEIYHNPVDTNVIIKNHAKLVVSNILNEKELDFTSL